MIPLVLWVGGLAVVGYAVVQQRADAAAANDHETDDGELDNDARAARRDYDAGDMLGSNDAADAAGDDCADCDDEGAL